MFKEIKEGLEKWKCISCSWIGRLYIMMAILLTFRFSAILIKITAGFFADIDKMITKFLFKFKGQGIVKTILKIKNSRFQTSLVAQWLRICLPMQGTRVRALVREDLTCRGATKPVCHNY